MPLTLLDFILLAIMLVSGLLAIRFMLGYVQRRSLAIFVVYRVLLAAVVGLWLALGR